MTHRVRVGSAEWNARDAVFAQHIRAGIDANGFVLLPVFPGADDGDAINFVYTIGMTQLGLPELLVGGMPEDIAGPLLIWAAQRHREQAFTAGDQCEAEIFEPLMPIRVIGLPHGTKVLGTARRYYPASVVRGLQLVLPDHEERFPNEPGYEGYPQSLF